MRLRPLLLTTLCLLGLPAALARAQGGPIMPLAQVHGGMDCIGETVVQGTTISQFAVHVIDVVSAPGQGTRILVSVSGSAVDKTGIAEGFSGSPVLCDDGTGTLRTIGAVSAGIGQYGNTVGLVTPIELMLGEPVRPPSSVPRLAVRARPLTGALTVAGLSPALAHLAEMAGSEAGRPMLAAPASSALSFPTQDLVPGASVGVAYSRGEVALGGIGTVTYRDGDVLYGFGHPMDGAGRRSLLLEDAYVYDVINNPNVDTSSYKLASFGHELGTLTSDTPSAVIGAVGPAPTMIPLAVHATDTDTGATRDELTQIADETDVGDPIGTSLLDVVAPFAVGQAAIDIYDGAPAAESGRMCLRLTVRESAAPLGFCNRYVSTGAPGGSALLPPSLALSSAGDVLTAVGLVDGATFAALHVTGVQVSIDAARGLRQAQLVSVRGPRTARAGSRIALSLLVRDYRGPLRRIAAQVLVPRGLHGPVHVAVRGPGSASGAGGPGSGSSGSGGSGSGSSVAAFLAHRLAAALAGKHSASSGSGSAPSGPPTSMAALRHAVAAIALPDQTTVRFGHRRAQHLPRDPEVLLTGTAGFTLQVR